MIFSSICAPLAQSLCHLCEKCGGSVGELVTYPVLATWDIRSEKRHLESELLVLFCLQERCSKDRIREHA